MATNPNRRNARGVWKLKDIQSFKQDGEYPNGAAIGIFAGGGAPASKVIDFIQTASTGKPKSWFIKAFEANPNARWQFGIDGLPEESHKYRVNQDGQKLFDIMCEAKNYLNKTPRWQYIVFKYNEEHIEQAKFMAKEKGLHFVVMQSHRWRGDDDPYLPSKEYRLETL